MSIGNSEPVSRSRCALAALFLVGILFGDVIFKGASLAPLDYVDALSSDSNPAPPVSVIPESAARKITDSWGDIGAAAWQFQPAVRMMAHVMRTGESPWWNPYEATGRMFPENMVDVPFSVITLTAAAFGGSSTAITFVLLALYFATAFCLIRSLNGHLRLSFLASCTAAAVYLLGGFSLGNLNAQMGQPYFLAPVVFLNLLALMENPTFRRLALATMAQAALFSVTFLPTMVLVTISVHLIVLALFLSQKSRASQNVRVVVIQASVGLLATCLVAFLYLPIVEATLNYSDTLAVYNNRSTPGYSLESALSLFTPKHFWQSYRGASADPGWPKLALESLVFHIGIFSSLLAASGLAWYKSRRTTALAVLCGLLVAVAVGQMFGIPPFTLIDRLPFFSFVRNEYWPALAGLPLVILVALGLDNRGKWSDVSVGCVAAGIGTSFLYLLFKLHLPVFQPARGEVIAFLTIFTAGLLLVLSHLLHTRHSRKICFALAIGAVGEGVYYMNGLHPVRSDRDTRLPETLAWVKSRVPSAGADRVLNLGGSGLMPNWSGGVQIPELGTIEVSVVPQYKTFFSEQIGNGLFFSLYSPQSDFRFTTASLSAVGVRYLIVDRSFTDAIARLERMGLKAVRQDHVRLIYENPAPAPRAFFSSRLIDSASVPWTLPGAELRTVTTHDSKLLQSARSAGLLCQVEKTNDPGMVKIEEYHHAHIKVHAVNHIPDILVLTDSWHPNWRATVDGVPAYIGCVNVAFRGVFLPPGDHVVEFKYEPKTLGVGLWISYASLAIVIGLLSYKRALFT